jgi:hypothetical protein
VYQVWLKLLQAFQNYAGTYIPNNIYIHFYIYKWYMYIIYNMIFIYIQGVPDLRRVFLMVKYTDITQNTNVQSWTVMEIMAREKCGILAGLCTIGISWHALSVYVLECDVISPHTSSCECADRNVTSESASLQWLETLRQPWHEYQLFCSWI